jgi:hypothetical protein
MWRLIPLPLVLLLAAATLGVPGCAEKENPPKKDYVPICGAVDTSLPPDVQVRQQVLKSMLDALTMGMTLDQLFDQNPTLRFDQSPAEFYERGAVGLAGWQFDGKPEGNDVPVVLYLMLDSAGRNQLMVRRVYRVTDSGGRLTISRKP